MEHVFGPLKHCKTMLDALPTLRCDTAGDCVAHQRVWSLLLI